MAAFIFFFTLFCISQLLHSEHYSFFGQEKVFKNYMKNIFLRNKLQALNSAIIEAARPYISIAIALLKGNEANHTFL